MIQLALKIEKTTQKQDILNYLFSHGSITRMEAFENIGVCELSSRIGELEHDGWTIPREWLHGQAANGRKWSVMKYLIPTRIQEPDGDS